MSLTATGVGSGLDIESLVTKLMEAERVPKEQQMLSRETKLSSDISGLAQLKAHSPSYKHHWPPLIHLQHINSGMPAPIKQVR